MVLPGAIGGWRSAPLRIFQAVDNPVLGGKRILSWHPTRLIAAIGAVLRSQEASMRRVAGSRVALSEIRLYCERRQYHNG
jgi:hypothetical protein